MRMQLDKGAAVEQHNRNSQPMVQVTEHGLDQWFKAEILALAEKKKSPLSIEERLYAADLCSRFARSEQAFGVLEGKQHLEPLALMLRRALDCDDDAERIRILRRMGDVALFTSGFFADRVEHKGLDIDYFVGMGGMAYSNVSSLAGRGRSAWRELYERLARNFQQAVHLLWDFVNSTGQQRNSDLLAQYREWERTGSVRLQRLLLAQGFALPRRTTRV
jgi:hypothetical protein